VVVLKRSQTFFDAHKEDFYRDRVSKKKGLVNMETPRPKDSSLRKFWEKRYFLFSKFDRGIRIDEEESWYSITPEPMAKQIASRVEDLIDRPAGPVILDAFTGVGGNLI